MPPSAETHSGRNRLRYSAAGLLGAVRDAVRRVSTFQALRFPLATILLFAAVGKTYAVYAGEAAAESLFALPGWLINLTITAEAAVAIWLLTRIRQHAAWLCTLVLFSLFLGFALYQSANNNEACDCLGIWAIAPKYMAVIDAFVVTSLLFLRPPFPQQGFMARFVEYIPGHAGFALLPVFAVALCITLINLRERPPSEVAELAVLGASDYSFGESMPGSVLDHTFKLRNQARYDLHIDEVKTSCSCMAFGSNTTGGTSILKPGDTFELRVQAACPDHVSSFTGKVLVYYRRAKGGEVAGPLRHVDLRLSSNILADYTIAPLEVDFGIIAPTAPDAEPVTRLL